MTADKEKANILNNFFFSLQFSLCNHSSHIPQAPEPQGRDWGNEVSLSVNSGLRPTESPMGTKGMHLRVLRDVESVFAKPLSIIFEKSWKAGEVPREKGVSHPFYRSSRKLCESIWKTGDWTQLAFKKANHSELIQIIVASTRANHSELTQWPL